MDMNFVSPDPEPENFCRIVIIGGGFSGACVALNLLGALKPSQASISIIEPRASLGAGLAYSATDPTHRVNVPAIRLLVHPDEPGAFHDWLERAGALREDPALQLPDGRRYPRRGTFGAYVTQRLAAAISAPGAPGFRHLRAIATEVAPDGPGFTVTLDSGARIQADVLVLAVSHPAPSILPVLRSIARSPKFFADPWSANLRAGIGPADDILIIGTALSTADVVATLDDAGHKGKILAISRRGLVSRERRVTSGGPFGDFTTNPSRTAVTLLRTARQTIRDAALLGGCWESVIEALRNQGQEIWAALSLAERRRFLRHLRPFWDVHRYQLAPQLARICAAKRANGMLSVQAARIAAASHDGTKFQITLNQRGVVSTSSFDAVINCTGPDHARVIETNPALASLARAGLIQPDPHRLGIDTNHSAQVLTPAGQPVPNLFVAGPLARASFGELMGLPQVTEHAALVARLVSASFCEQKGTPRMASKKL